MNGIIRYGVFKHSVSVRSASERRYVEQNLKLRDIAYEYVDYDSMEIRERKLYGKADFSFQTFKKILKN